MGYGIVLTMDPETDGRFRALWQALADADITSVMLTSGEPPHLTIGILPELPSDFLPALEAFAKCTQPVETHLSAVGAFARADGVVFIAPTVNQPLLTLHRRFHEALASIGVTSQGYLPGTWVPHCTVGVELSSEQVLAAVDLCRHSDILGPVRFEAIELFEFFPVRPVCRVPLG